MPSILGANEIKATGFNVANSARFNDDDGAYLVTLTERSQAQENKLFPFGLKEDC